ncbi:MAG: S8 family peptidase [Candidatus Scalinduaceae bacterium]
MKRVQIILGFLINILLLSAPCILASVEISKGRIPEHYIVVLNNDTVRTVPDVANDMARTHGLTIGHIYRHAIKGFSARIPDQRLEVLKSDPRVKRIDVDRVVYAMPKPPGKGKPGNGDSTPPPPQELSTGVDRVDAEKNTTPRPVDVDIAIIDTGIDLDHPDLNVVANVSFVNSKNGGDDDNGHGSHVAGIAAAKDNNIGVVGVAPGARLWAVKVLDRRGSGSWSSVIAGIDWVTGKADQIEVANMSLGGSGSDTASSLRMAIDNSVASGITHVVSAGNSARDAKDFVPASYDSVITVSAIADSDGQPGGNGPNTSYGADDTFATFSNFGADVDIAAPGVDIYSCWKKGGYNTISGTSMSAPHVTGAAALYISNNQGILPGDVLLTLIITGEYGGFTGDPDTFQEPLLNASEL